MTTRHSAYLVILSDDVREEYENILLALRMVHGVLDVKPVEAQSDLVIAQARRDRAWRQALQQKVDELNSEMDVWR